ncbi:hypothetical protein ACFQX7_38605 [Luedemannella flava]
MDAPFGLLHVDPTYLGRTLPGTSAIRRPAPTSPPFAPLLP